MLLYSLRLEPHLKLHVEKPVTTLGQCVLKVNLNDLWIFSISMDRYLDNTLMILGWDFFHAIDAVIDCGNEELKLAEIPANNITLGR